MGMDLMDHAVISANMALATQTIIQAQQEAIANQPVADNGAAQGVAIGLATVIKQERAEKNEIIDKYNALVKKYDVDMEYVAAAKEHYKDFIRENHPEAYEEVCAGAKEAAERAEAETLKRFEK